MTFYSPYKKTRKIATADEDTNLQVALGNEVLLGTFSVTLSAAAATKLQFVVPYGVRYKISRVSTRATTSAAGSGGGVAASIDINSAADLVAVASKVSLVNLPLTIATVGADTTFTKERCITANYTLNPGDYVDVVTVQGTQADAAGVVIVSIWAHEIPIN